MNEEKEKPQWSAAEVLVAAQNVEAFEFALSDAGADGTEIDLLGKKLNDDEPVKIVAYFAEKPSAEDFESNLAAALSICGLTVNDAESIIWREVEDKDWNAEWKKNWKPTQSGSFIVAPSWSEIEADDSKIVIRIEPKMAFGTGTHETTRLCLREIEKNYQGESFFDVGTGTGVLAIAAAKLKKTNEKIVGCDTDKDSVELALENAELNECARQIEFYQGSINENSPEFDFVCANLTADVIVPLTSLLTAKARRKLLLSGILAEQENWVASELEKFGVKNLHVEQDGMWISIYAEKV